MFSTPFQPLFLSYLILVTSLCDEEVSRQTAERITAADTETIRVTLRGADAEIKQKLC